MIIILQVLLLKHCSSAFSLLHTVQRSLCSTHLILPNDTLLPIASVHSSNLVSIVSRIIDELLLPLRRINVEKAELSTLKALVLLHPDVMGLNATSREKLREARDGVLRALFTYLSQILTHGDTSVRLSNLLLVIPALYSIAHSLTQSSQLGTLFGLIDQTPSPNNAENSPGNTEMSEENFNNIYKDNSLMFAKTTPSLLASLVASQALSNYGNLQGNPTLTNSTGLPVSNVSPVLWESTELQIYKIRTVFIFDLTYIDLVHITNPV